MAIIISKSGKITGPRWPDTLTPEEREHGYRGGVVLIRHGGGYRAARTTALGVWYQAEATPEEIRAGRSR